MCFCKILNAEVPLSLGINASNMEGHAFIQGDFFDCSAQKTTKYKEKLNYQNCSAKLFLPENSTHAALAIDAR